jgi:prephenate dehydrogenase
MAGRSLARRSPFPAGLRRLAGCTVGVIGAGQVGGSIIQRLGLLRPAVTVVATDRNTALAGVVRRHARWRPAIRSVVAESDLVVLAVPGPAIVRLLRDVARHAARRGSRRRLLVIDTGTIKGPVVAAAAGYADAFDFVGLHPIAGVERNGWASARADMFERQTVIYCPAAPSATAVAREFIRLLGARPVRMAPDIHDARVAEGIGLPHIVAFAAAGAIAGTPTHPLRAGSWRSLTRVAVSDAAMVAGFLAGNPAAQLPILRRFQARLAAIERQIQHGSPKRLERQLRAWQPDGRRSR